MASITPRKNKAGEIVSYQVKVSRGRDALTGKPLTPYTTTYTPPEGWSLKTLERDMARFVGEFEAACKRGEVLTREEAKAREKAQQEAAEAAKREAERKPTFNQYIERYIDDISNTHADGTAIHYRHTLNKAAEVFGDKKLADVDYLSIRVYLSDLQSNGLSSRGKPYSHTTIVWHYLVLSAFFKHALENDVITVNPMDRVKCPRPPKDTTSNVEPDSLSEADVQHILACAALEPPKWNALIVMALDSGMRRGELIGLKWENINFQTGHCDIIHNAQYYAERGTFLTTPKSGKTREIYLSRPTLAILTKWRREQAEQCLKMGVPRAEFVFTRDIDSEIMNPCFVTSYIKRFGQRIGLPNLHPHTFRHTSASLAITHGADVVSVSKRLGHSSPTITMDIYAHSAEEAQRRLSETLESAIFQNNAQKK